MDNNRQQGHWDENKRKVNMDFGKKIILIQIMLNGDVSAIELRCCIYTLMVFTNIMIKHAHNTLISFKFVKHEHLMKTG